MPIYEYSCDKCGRFEAIQKISDEPLVQKPGCDCADCPKSAKREVSAAAFHLKGSGWYKTDYASKSSNGGSKGGSSSSSGSSGESSSSSSASESGGDKKAACGTGCGCH